MNWIAWKMLIGNRGKYLGIVLGIAFAALLIAQQSSIFCGLMNMTTSQIRDVKGVDLWVMDPNVQFVGTMSSHFRKTISIVSAASPA
jgi:putative ABC transport system permease protein